MTELELVGGDVVLDFVNTVTWRLRPDRLADELRTPEVLVAWLLRTGLVRQAPAPVSPQRAARTLSRVRDLREDLYAVLAASIAGREPPPSDRLHRTMLRALARARVVSVVPLRESFVPSDVADVPVLLALEARRFLRDVDPVRLRQCADDGCGWLFLDRSRNGSRRWCSSADCGNRARARRHYERTRGQ
ncbi:putative RNA-binding Zn ribbon-like protein [Amycolatopsis bartoniae]|uniref:Zinc finger CGNR domain-containing protein n=1 Tax=Amycolatopsis bartoniae TaxID=941986 RepID=A0A8H9IRF0_9PSEU|nr:CGNR zinc finger domain-containing protein [Amycolatopsis bartoniae]MBB2937798.1 putative RNA-binding Zn ribbon-like protein [Amycolatopsis bartoniae]TVT06533.1 hypothetical protein FNH07_19815 [Amycolatopsis bartoniae]GHF40784.1 hypothetical protein GCM10017566_12760 [Amycolatopsis bartoniae]